jgi:Tic22-like family
MVVVMMIFLWMSTLCGAFHVIPTATTTTASPLQSSFLSSNVPRSTTTTTTRNVSLQATPSSSASARSKIFPALSREDIETLLSTIPIYAITDTNKDGGLVLLDEPNNPNSLAYFFCSPETAIAAFKPYKEKLLSMEQQQPQQQVVAVEWDVTRFSLALIWSELLKPPGIVNGVEYRLIPHPPETAHARSLLEQSALERGLTRPPQVVFGVDSYNEIPIFMDPTLRLVDANGKERVPMYLGYNDMMDAYQQVRGDENDAAPSSSSSSTSKTSFINVIELFSLLGQMEQESTTTDFSKVLLVPFSPPLRNEESRGLLDDILPSQKTLEKRQQVVPITPSMGSDGWSD